MRTQHHLRMRDEIALIRSAASPSSAGTASARSSQAGPPGASPGGASGRTACRRRRRCRRWRGSCLRAAGPRDQIGHAGDVLARGASALSIVPVAGDERGETARLQPVDRPGDEIIVQRSRGGRGRVGLRTMRSENGGLPMARSKPAGGRCARSPRCGCGRRGCTRRAMRAVTGSSSMPVNRLSAQLLRHQREEQARAACRAPAPGRRESRAAAGPPRSPGSPARACSARTAWSARGPRVPPA